MKKICLGNAVQEWHWTQTFQCGCEKPMVIMADKRNPRDIRRELRQQPCPTCQINELLEA